jgi:TetR/AcrR family fatty acid metabolism transcriptional regulator
MTRRQERIIKEAIHLISEGGIQGFTILKLARRIEVTEPAIYRHFKSKNEILQKILSIYTEFLKQTLLSALQSDLTAFERLRFIIRGLVNYFEENPKMVVVVYAEEIFHFEPDLFEIVKEQLNESKRTLTEIVKIAQEKTEFRNDLDTEVISFLLVGAIRNLMIEWKFSNYQLNLADTSKQIFQGIEKLLIPQN